MWLWFHNQLIGRTHLFCGVVELWLELELEDELDDEEELLDLEYINSGYVIMFI